MRLLRKKIFKIGTVVFCLLFGVLVLYNRSENVGDKMKLNEIIERSIRSAINQGPCRQPFLPIDNPEIMKFYKTVDKIDCGNSVEDWVRCEKSTCYIKPEINASHGDVICSFTDLIRKTDHRIKYGKTKKTKELYTLQESDFVKVTCKSTQSGKSWSGLAFGIRDTVRQNIPHASIVQSISTNPTDGSLMSAKSPPFFNVLIYGFDSLSRNAFIRKLPKTYAYLTKELKSIVLQGYNVIGDGTTMALVPLLTGFTELELPETRKRMTDSHNVDIYPFIWQDYARLGYITSFNEDVPDIGTFTYRLKGFAQQPTDHYLRTFYVESQNIWRSNKDHCIGHQPDHIVMLEYTRQFMTKYISSPRFVFSFHGGLSHDSINLIGAADSDVFEWLNNLKEKHLLDNTILIFMADHGNRFHEVRATLQGKQEERLPFFSFVFPELFRQYFPQEYANFMKNADRLVTPYDVHATLKDILRLQNISINVDQKKHDKKPLLSIPQTKLAKERAISLFNLIPENRSCRDAFIEPHWCTCLMWQQIAVNDTDHKDILLKFANNIVETINVATKEFRELCAPLELDNINWAMCLLPHKEMLQYKTAGDQDGFVADLSDSTIVKEKLYQLQIVVKPGYSLFEATITYDIKSMKAITKLSDISRVNKYGSQAKCIYERNPDLRKFCYCRI